VNRNSPFSASVARVLVHSNVDEHDRVHRTCPRLGADVSYNAGEDSAHAHDGEHPRGNGYPVVATIAHGTLSTNYLIAAAEAD